MITKADYDELVRLRGLEMNWVAADISGAIWAFEDKPDRRYKHSAFHRFKVGRWDADQGTAVDASYGTLLFLIWEDEPLNIAAAIAEYERAQEVNHE